MPAFDAPAQKSDYAIHLRGPVVASESSCDPGLDWKRIEEFISFGRENAPIVFIEMEEGVKDADVLLEDPAIRSTYESPVMDLKEAHRGIVGTERYFDPTERRDNRPGASWPTSCSGASTPGPLRRDRNDGDTARCTLDGRTATRC
jgi:hypothetical protein